MMIPLIYRHMCRDVRRFGCLPWWLMFRCLPALVCLGLSLLLLSAAAARAQHDGVGEIGAGELLLSDAEGRLHRAVTQRSKVHLDISGMIAVVHLEQAFTNNTQDWVEGVYAYPLPEDSAVRHMEMRVGQRRIVGEIREKAEAKEVYRDALKAGKKASLVEQQRPNLFTTRVANIAPGEEVRVVLEYVQPVQYRDGLFSLRLPTTLTPRYMPGEPESAGERQHLSLLPAHGWAVPTDRVPDAERISPLQWPLPGSDRAPMNPLEISVRLDAGMPLASVASPYHQVVLSRRDGIYDIRLPGNATEMDRDFVLNWRPVTGSTPTAALFTERVGGEFYGLLMLVPPAVGKAPEPPARELVFVVDTSGSMGGISIRQARRSLHRALDLLRPQDSFNIIEFNSSHRSLFRTARPATAHYLQLAGEFVRHLDASGGTEMLPALRAALAPGGEVDELSPAPLLRQVIFITDGAVGNEEALFGEIVQHLGRNRLFTVGIGSAPNSWFMRKAAEYGRGSYTTIADVQEVGGTMSDLFRQLAAPVALEVAVDWPDPAEAWPQRIPDLYLGEPLMLAVKFGEQLPTADLTVTGLLAGRNWQSTLQMPNAAPLGQEKMHPGVASLWARRKIESLLSLPHRGVDAQEVRGQVLPLALQHRLLSPYTSFVAVEEVVSRPPEEGVEGFAVPNTRPAGQSPQPYAYPRTATTAAANVWLASLLLLSAIVIRLCRQEDEYA